MFRSKIIIDLNAICDNYISIQKYVGGKTEVSAVLKANAYGLGAKFIAPKLYDVGCRHFWVAYLSEAMVLREVLPYDVDIYVLQGFESNDVNLLKRHKITQVINSKDEFDLISGYDLPIVLFVETGLNRLGLKENEIEQIIDKIKNEDIRYIISHLACSGDTDNKYNSIQKDNFNDFLSKIRQYKPNVKASLAASDGIFLEFGDYCYDLVRPGIALYGFSNGKKQSFLKNAISFESKVLQKYTIPKNTPVGYGNAYITNKSSTKIALVSAGYADGIPYQLSNCGFVAFGEYSAPIIGKVSMDLVTCDVTNIPDELTNPGCTAIFFNDYFLLSDIGSLIKEPVSRILSGFKLNSNRIEISYIG